MVRGIYEKELVGCGTEEARIEQGESIQEQGTRRVRTQYEFEKALYKPRTSTERAQSCIYEYAIHRLVSQVNVINSVVPTPFHDFLCRPDSLVGESM